MSAKLTREQIIRALRCCSPNTSDKEPDCLHCPMEEDTTPGVMWCSLDLMAMAADELEGTAQ